MNAVEKLSYIQKQIENNNYKILPDSIAEGTVYKIHYSGDLDKDGYEVGFLYLIHGTSIKEHIHTNDIEMYKPLVGTLSVLGEEVPINYCLFDEKHNIDKVTGVLIVETVKLSREYLKQDINTKDKEYQKVLLRKKCEIIL